MAKKKKPPNGGLTPAKGALIGILAVVLLVVIVTQFGGSKSSVARAPRKRQVATELPNVESANTSGDPAIAAKRHEKSWPTFAVENVIASNPFVLPDVILQNGQAAGILTASSQGGESEIDVAAIEAAEIQELRYRQSQFMASLRAKGVDMIIRSPRGSVARIGELSLRIGDVHEGLRVEEIGQRGVVFAPADAGDGQVE